MKFVLESGEFKKINMQPKPDKTDETIDTFDRELLQNHISIGRVPTQIGESAEVAAMRALISKGPKPEFLKFGENGDRTTIWNLLDNLTAESIATRLLDERLGLSNTNLIISLDSTVAISSDRLDLKQIITSIVEFEGEHRTAIITSNVSGVVQLDYVATAMGRGTIKIYGNSAQGISQAIAFAVGSEA